jgi:pimeloyl-ACP methyl ester carboxylesterase
MRVETLGQGARVILVHGSVAGPATWSAQRTLADRFRLEILTRPGFSPESSVERVDFEEHADLVAALLDGEPAHLVGHSYGGVISLLAAARRPAGVRSLTVAEPPCFDVARGDPAVEAFVAKMDRLWTSGPREPRAFLQAFLAGVGSSVPTADPLPPGLAQGARTLMVERSPHEARIPLAELAAEPFPKLVVSGAHHPAFDAVCDVLERALGAERAVLAGSGHGVQRVPGFNDVLADFLERATP